MLTESYNFSEEQDLKNGRQQMAHTEPSQMSSIGTITSNEESIAS